MLYLIVKLNTIHYSKEDPAQQGNVEVPVKRNEKCPDLTISLLGQENLMVNIRSMD